MITSAPLYTRVESQFLHCSFSSELRGLVAIPSGPASRRTVALTETIYSLQAGLHPSPRAMTRTSRVAPLRPRASSRLTGARRRQDQACERGNPGECEAECRAQVCEYRAFVLILTQRWDQS